MKSLIGILAALLLLLILLYILGPKAKYASYDNTPINENYSLGQIQEQITQRELATESLKPNNEATIIWADSINKTENVILYMHGFSASHFEGDPIHRNLAKRYGCNLVLARFPECGVRVAEPMLTLTPDKYIAYGKEIINQAAQLGDSLYIMSTSTGSTVSTYLAANDDRIKGLIMLSPNFAVKDPMFDYLDGPWGLQMANFSNGSKYRTVNSLFEFEDYWIPKYRNEALVSLDHLVSNTMTDELFQKINTPFYIGYYDGDNTISVNRIKEFYALAKSKNSLVEIFSDANAHVIGSSARNSNWRKVQSGIEAYLEFNHGFSATKY